MYISVHFSFKFLAEKVPFQFFILFTYITYIKNPLLLICIKKDGCDNNDDNKNCVILSHKTITAPRDIPDCKG